MPEPMTLARQAQIEHRLGIVHAYNPWLDRNEFREISLELLCEVERLREELRLARGAMDAQDGREQAAGDKCGVLYAAHGCDWPDAVAEELLAARAELARK